VTSLADRPILPAVAIIVPEKGGLSGSKVMDWFKRKTTIAGYQISNWLIVLGAIIIVLLIFQILGAIIMVLLIFQNSH
jgi:hypothetical protein